MAEITKVVDSKTDKKAPDIEFCRSLGLLEFIVHLTFRRQDHRLCRLDPIIANHELR